MNLRNMKPRELLTLAGVPIITDEHFVYTSGAHGPGYVNLRTLNAEGNEDILTEVAYRLVQATLLECKPKRNRQIVFAGPDTLGAILAKIGVEEYVSRHPGAYELEWLHIQVQAEKNADGTKRFKLNQPDTHFVLTQQVQVFWVDDLLNRSSTFKSTRSLIEDELPGAIKGVAVVMDRSNETARSLGVPDFVYLDDVVIPSFPADECPLCERGHPIELNVGHGKDFASANPDYKGGFVRKHLKRS